MIPLAFAECRQDFSGDVSDAELAGVVDSFISTGHYQAYVYGPESVAERLKERGLAAYAFVGPRGKTIITADQLFYDEFSLSTGTDCPVIQSCDSAKLYKDSWYCHKDNVWQGPCAHKGCIGDLIFDPLPDNMRQLLDNVVGDDVDSLRKAIDRLSGDAAVLGSTRNNLHAAELYQEALELSLRSSEINEKDIVIERNRQFFLALETASSQDEAKRLLSLSRRAEKTTPIALLTISDSALADLEKLSAPPRNWTILILWGIVIFALILMFFILVHIYAEGRRSAVRQLDEAAKDIVLDIDELEMSLVKKKGLVDDYQDKLRGLG